jgi:hypothetical protein
MLLSHDSRLGVCCGRESHHVPDLWVTTSCEAAEETLFGNRTCARLCVREEGGLCALGGDE